MKPPRASPARTHRRHPAIDGLPHADWPRIESVGDVALALIHADALVFGDGHARGVVKLLVAEATPLRRKVLAGATALAAQDLLPADAVRAIQKGRGSRDIGNDLLALSSLFRAHAAKIQGKHAVTEAQLARAAALGAEIVANTRSRTTKRSFARVGDARAAAELRDRVFTLLHQRYAHLGQAAGAVWGLDVTLHVPRLGSAVRARKAPQAATPKG